MEGEIWYEMAGEPISVETDQGIITITGVVRKDNDIVVELAFDDFEWKGV